MRMCFSARLFKTLLPLICLNCRVPVYNKRWTRQFADIDALVAAEEAGAPPVGTGGGAGAAEGDSDRLDSEIADLEARLAELKAKKASL